MKYSKSIIIFLTFIAFSSISYGQLELIGQYRARAEFLDGYKQPLLESQDPGFFISQRARLGLQYTHSRFQFNLTAQDIRVWGSTSSFAVDKSGFFSIYEASASVFFTNKWSMKLGRQPIQYDNGRIFGISAWGMAAKRHDAAILKYQDSTWQVDVGAAYNQQGASPTQTLYELNNYKTFHYAWAKKKWKDVSMSLLFLNNGIDQIYFQDSIKKSKTNFTQTMGTYIEYTRSKFDVVAYGYYQMGFNRYNQTLQAYNASVLGSYKPIKAIKLTLGGEILSGTSQEATLNDRSHSFSTLHNSNHPLNGFMDYFYAGNHEENVGLVNAFLKLNYSVGNFNFGMDNHVFFTAAPAQNMNPIPQVPGFLKADPYLGYEMDFTVKYKWIDEVMFQAGYSLLAGTETLRDLKGADNDKLSHWAYVMVTVHPFKNLILGKTKEKD